MQSNNRYRGIDSYALSCVRYHANRLSQYHPCFSPEDYEDIEQELVMYFLVEAPKYDPAKSEWKLHVFMILQRHAKHMVEKAEAQKRGGHSRPLSIYQPIVSEMAEDHGLSLIDTIGSEDGLWGDAFGDWNAETGEMKSDVKKAMAGLSPRLRQLCLWLQYENPSEISRRTGIPRTTLNSLITTLRKRLREAGLENYFHATPSLSETPPK